MRCTLTFSHLTLRSVWQIVVIICTLASCKTQNLFQSPKNEESLSVNTFLKVKANYQYVIRKDDKINISVWDHDELSVGSLYGVYNSNEVYGKWLLVNGNGDINVPKIGPVHVSGLTVIQLEDSLKLKFGDWIKAPVVNIRVLNKEVTVLGEMKSPGKISVDKDNNTLIDILAKAGDFDFYANKKKVKVIRVENNQPREITIDLTSGENFMARNIQIIPGDLIYVPSKKGKDFDKRFSTIMPFLSIVSALAIGYGTFF